MASKLNYYEISDIISSIPTEGMQAHYAVGALMTMMTEAISNMSKKDQEYFIGRINWLKDRTAEIESGY